MIPIFLVVAGSTSTSIFTGSKHAVTIATASELLSVFSCRATLASLQDAPNTTNTGRLLMVAAAFACSSEGCQGMPVGAAIAQHGTNSEATTEKKARRQTAW